MGASNSADYHDMSAIPRRYLQREWKRNKPHLPPSDSLPTLRLPPKRPLFVCAQCGFANAWIPLCLWCEWTSVEATKQFEASLPRPRRLSAPSRTVPNPKKRKQTPPRRMSADSAVSSAGPATPQGERIFSSGSKVVPGITTVLAPLHGDMCHGEELLVSNNRDGDTVALAVVATDTNVADDVGGVGQVVTATSTTSPPPSTSIQNVTPEHRGELVSEHRALKRNSRRHLRRPPALSIFTPPTQPLASCYSSHKLEVTGANNSPATQASNSATSVLIEAPNSLYKRKSMDIPDGAHVRSIESISSSRCSPSRGLRRMKNMTLIKRGSSLSLRSRSGPSSPLRESIEIPTSATEVRRSHALSFAPSHDHDPPPVRLGHPSRPYYSVIRKEMSRPTSPVFSLAAPRTPSPIPSHPDYVPRETKSLDCGDRSGIQYARDLRPMSMVLPSQAMPTSPGFGFSFSGETEMRMSLSRWRRENAPDEPGDYLFRETSPSRTKVDVMKGRVRQIGKGLKELVLGRS